MLETQRTLISLNKKLERLVDLRADSFSTQLSLGVAFSASKYTLAMEYREVLEQVKRLKLILKHK